MSHDRTTAFKASPRSWVWCSFLPLPFLFSFPFFFFVITYKITINTLASTFLSVPQSFPCIWPPNLKYWVQCYEVFKAHDQIASLQGQPFRKPSLFMQAVISPRGKVSLLIYFIFSMSFLSFSLSYSISRVSVPSAYGVIILFSLTFKMSS